MSAAGAQRARPRLPRIDGLLNVNKPEGVTSMEVVRRIKRVSGQKRVGHGGTLDPFATGVIPICLGQATRMMEYLIEGTKKYRAVVELGVETDTYDVQGTVVARSDVSGITRQDVEDAAAGFVGRIDQVPPMYSALKRDGKRLYDLARAGVDVEREPRSVEVSGIDVHGWDRPLFEIEVTCGRGFYMRSLAHDIGQSLGCGGHLRSLARLKSGALSISESMALEDAERCFEDGAWRRVIHAPDVAVRHLRAAVVDSRVEETIRHGRPLPSGLRLPDGRRNEHCRVYATDGRFIGLVAFNSSAGQWQPHRVFSLSYPLAEDAPGGSGP